MTTQTQIEVPQEIEDRLKRGLNSLDKMVGWTEHVMRSVYRIPRYRAVIVRDSDGMIEEQFPTGNGSGYYSGESVNPSLPTIGFLDPSSKFRVLQDERPSDLRWEMLNLQEAIDACRKIEIHAFGDYISYSQTVYELGKDALNQKGESQ